MDEHVYMMLHEREKQIFLGNWYNTF